jgi:hypothetical protein
MLRVDQFQKRYNFIRGYTLSKLMAVQIGRVDQKVVNSCRMSKPEDQMPLCNKASG